MFSTDLEFNYNLFFYEKIDSKTTVNSPREEKPLDLGGKKAK
jgi:hypothetical protein